VADLDPFVQVECPDCTNIETVSAKLGPFRLLNLIGTGGMGGVYYAKDESLGRFVAIKVMLTSIGENKEFIESFKHEAQAVARLNHPNIVQIYSFGQEKGQPFIVMELVSGQRFDKMVETKKALDQAFVMRVGLDIAEGLKAADEAGILHGDIKPENILLDEKLRAKLVDFGIATFANQGQADGIWGTPYYIAPEKVRRQKVDCRADIYGLGATLFHALTGHPPFEGKTPIDVVKARLEHPAPELHLIRRDIDPLVEKIIARMLEGDQNKRYPNYNSLTSDMRKAVQHLGSPGAVSGLASDINRKSGKVYASRQHATGSMPGTPQDMPPPPAYPARGAQEGHDDRRACHRRASAERVRQGL
jgi:serine/threonine protein kinase